MSFEDGMSGFESRSKTATNVRRSGFLLSNMVAPPPSFASRLVTHTLTMPEEDDGHLCSNRKRSGN